MTVTVNFRGQLDWVMIAQIFKYYLVIVHEDVSR
jgi:hypothetical protein